MESWRTSQEQQTSPLLALSLSSARIGINAVPCGPDSGCKAIHESTGNMWRQWPSKELVAMSPWLLTFCLRRWHSRQDVAERPLLGFSTGLSLLILMPSEIVVRDSLMWSLRRRERCLPAVNLGHGKMHTGTLGKLCSLTLESNYPSPVTKLGGLAVGIPSCVRPGGDGDGW